MKKLKTMDVILICLGITLLAFTISMIVTFFIKDSVPDTLITCVFGFCGGGECSCMAAIQVAKVISRKETEKDDEC